MELRTLPDLDSNYVVPAGRAAEFQRDGHVLLVVLRPLMKYGPTGA